MNIMLYATRTPESQVEVELGNHTLLIPSGDGNEPRLTYFPDEPPAFISAPNVQPCRFLLVALDQTLLMQGDTLETARLLHPVLAPSRNGGFDNDYAGISSVYSDPTSGMFLGFYHAETAHKTALVSNKKGEEKPARYWSIGLATSDDGENAFTRVDQILRPSIPIGIETHANQGIGDVCVIENANKDFLYAYYTDITRRSASYPAGIALARCKTMEATDPRSWRKLSDAEKEEFNGAALCGIETRVLVRDRCDVSQPHVTYLDEWPSYLMVCCVLADTDFDPRTSNQSGIYLYHSADGISWKEVKRLFPAFPIPLNGVEYTAHPSLYLPTHTRTTAQGWLLYCYSKCWGEKPNDPDGGPHYMCGRTIKLTFRSN